MIKTDCVDFLENLDRWAAPETPEGLSLIDALNKPRIYRDARGVVLILGAFNYPFQLLFVPLLGAIGGGNAAVVKPSEVAPHSAALMTELIERYLDTDAIKVVNGAVEETTVLLKERFDLVFYTGSSAVGKIVYKAAAEHLTPCILELGGKNPCFVDAASKNNLEVCAQRIVWGRLINNGQVRLLRINKKNKQTKISSMLILNLSLSFSFSLSLFFSRHVLVLIIFFVLLRHRMH